MKKHINEIYRMQQLAGINEIRVATPGKSHYLNFSQNDVINILTNNEIDIDDEEGIDTDSEEWMDVLSDIIGKNAYDQDNWTEEDHMKVGKFIKVVEEMGIEFI